MRQRRGRAAACARPTLTDGAGVFSLVDSSYGALAWI